MGENDDVRFEDAESYNPNYLKDKLSFRDIILNHLRKISQFSSVEFIGGYWEDKPVMSPNSNMAIKVYVPDTREIYSNAVECFADMLAPYFDKEMKRAEEQAEQEKEQARKEYKDTCKGIRSKGEIPDIFIRVEFRDIKRKINKKLFRSLCSFLYRKKYLELGEIQD